ncbi:glycosyltransferase [Gemmobacter sp. 24YEA27]|uniref:glycosyltransferase n=1 Tax=Gemmobacter sp. 24YEA27 TaxID=3040672 RepID=UPI0024B3C646|nr:glycosyltransferase [Gemmobacter sp. 24YEA27]
MLRDIARQTRLPDRVILVITAQEDLDFADLRDVPFSAQVLTAEPGLTRQRNAALEAAAPDDLLLFLDDDFVMAEDYVANLYLLLTTMPDLVMLTGMCCRWHRRSGPWL